MKTNSILDEICARKRVELEASKKELPLDEIFELVQNAPMRASFKDALKAQNGVPAVIAELKKASPSMGLIRADFNPHELAPQLQAAGASALSVLTEKEFFMGSPEYLRTAVLFTDIPIIRKDFIFDQYQICEAKMWGASAVLLIAAMLSADEFKFLYDFAHSLDLDVLAEAHNGREIEMLLNCGADIVGVNCRNLKNFHTDAELANSLMKDIPQGVVKVSESAMRTHEDLVKAAMCGADAALIGTALMSKPNPAEELKKLLGKK